MLKIFRGFFVTIILIAPQLSLATTGGPYVIQILGIEKRQSMVVFVDGWRDASGYGSTLRKYDIEHNTLEEKAFVDLDVSHPDQVLKGIQNKLRPIKNGTLKSAGFTTQIKTLRKGNLTDPNDFRPFRILQIEFTDSKMKSLATITLYDYRQKGDPMFTAYMLPRENLTIVKINYVGVPYETGYTMDRLLFFKTDQLVLEFHGVPSSLFPETNVGDTPPK